MSFPSLPPEIWELIICDYNLLSHMKTIKTIPSRHNLNDIMCNLIQPYINHMCQLFYSINTKIIDKPYIFNTKNLYYIIIYFINDIRPDNLPTIFIRTEISIILNNKRVNINTCDKRIKYYTNDLLHNIDGHPAVIKWCNDEEAHLIPYYIGTKQEIIYYNNGCLHRINGPAKIWNASGYKEETYCQNNSSYRKDGPTYIFWHPNGYKLTESYGTNHGTGRVDGPAKTEWYENGNKFKESYYKYGLVHRTDGPAIIEWYNNQSGSNVVPTEPIGSKEPGTDLSLGTTFRTGNKKQETYYLRNMLHRTDGPAIIKWDENGCKISEEYYIEMVKIL
jgi:hypothetical protein